MINTSAVNLDLNPATWLSDERVQTHLPREYVLAFVNLMAYAMQLSATTESQYVDGEFSYATALKRVRNLTPEAIQAMEDAQLVEHLDGDVWSIEFITPQTSHEALQNSADARRRAGKTKRASNERAKQALVDAEAKAQHRREQDRDRQRAHREREQELIGRGKDVSDSGKYRPSGNWTDDEPPF